MFKELFAESKEQYWIVNKFSGKIIQGSYNSEKTATKIYKNGNFTKDDILVKSSETVRSTTQGNFLRQYVVVMNEENLRENEQVIVYTAKGLPDIMYSTKAEMLYTKIDGNIELINSINDFPIRDYKITKDGKKYQNQIKTILS